MMRSRDEIAALLAKFEPHTVDTNNSRSMETLAVCDTLRWVLVLVDDTVFQEYVHIPMDPAELDAMVANTQARLRQLVDDQRTE